MILYHYCSNQSFLSILKSKSIWLSELSLSNDYMEGQWVRHVFSLYCKDKEVDDTVVDKLLPHLDRFLSGITGSGFCLSEEGDMLSQWRGYADNGGGVSIGFKQEYLEGLNEKNPDERYGFRLHKVEYDLERQKKQIQPNMDEILKYVEQGALNLHVGMGSILFEPDEEKMKEQRALFINMGQRFLLFIRDIYTIKNPAFVEENEWRLVSIGVKPEVMDNSHEHMNFRARGERIVPYIEVPLMPSDEVPFAEIVLGPRNSTPTVFVEGALARYGFKGVAVRKSSASYR